MGKEWAYIALTKTNNGMQIWMYTGTYFQGYDKTEKIESIDFNANELASGIYFIKLKVDNNFSKIKKMLLLH